MADDFQQKILITAEAKTEQVRQDILGLNNALLEQIGAQKKLELQGKRNSDAYVNISSQVRLTRQAIRDTNREFDNAVKAINASSNSIQQNRALLSTLMAEYIKLSQSEGSTAASTLKLKANIDQLTTSLKEQEKQIGQTNRNVGNYANDIGAALGKLTGSIPGLQQFSGITQTAVKVVGFLPSAFTKAGNAMNSFIGNPGRNVIQGFGGMKQSTVEATEAIEGVAPAAAEAGEDIAGIAPATAEAAGGMAAVTAGSVATGGAIAALVGIIAGAVVWFQSLGSVGLKSAQVFDGVKASAIAFFNDLQKGDMSHFADDMKKAYNNGVELKKGLQDLEFKQQAADETVAQYDRVIASNMLALRYRKITLDQAKVIDKETGEMEKSRVDLKTKLAQRELDIAINQSMNGKKYSEKELEQTKHFLYQDNIAKIQWLERNDKINKGAADQIHDANMKYIAAEQEADLSEQKSKNRLAIIEMRFGKGAKKAAEQQTNEMAHAEHNLREAEQVREMSAARQLQFTMAAYGKELEATNQHYEEMIYKEMQFVAQQEKLAHLAHSPGAKNKFNQARDKGLQAIEQMQKEWDADLQERYEANRDKMYNLVLKANDELKQSAIANIKDNTERQIASLALQEQIRNEDFEKEKTERLKQINDLKMQAAGAQGDEKDSLMLQANQLENIQEAADHKKIEEAQSTADAILKIKKKGFQDEIAAQDKSNVDSAKPFSPDSYKAQKQQATDEADTQISNATETPGPDGLVQDTAGIRAKYNQKITDIDVAAALQRKQFTIKIAQETVSATSQIAENAIRQNSENQIAAMEKQKEYDLRNTSLTVDQKAIISDNYTKKENQVKRKAFIEDQAVKISQAVMSTALGVAAAEEAPYLAPFVIPTIIATGATEVAVIAAQKAPNYATGGLHYTSDGTGGYLRGPGNGTSDSMNAKLSNGESVINANSTRKFADILSAINVAGGGRPFNNKPYSNTFYQPHFATGGVYTPTSDNGLRPSQANYNAPTGPVRLHADDIQSIANAVASMPAPIVDVKDVNYEQSKLAYVQDRGNY